MQRRRLRLFMLNRQTPLCRPPLSVVLGLFLGRLLHSWLVLTVEVDMVMFGRAVYWPSYVYSAVLTILFGMLVNLVMHHKLKKISMVESMKAPE